VEQGVDGADTREALYQQLIMERARQPLHAGILDPADGAGDGNTPFCGDRVHVTLALSPERRVSRMLHRTRGCAICMASADLMAETVVGLDESAIRSLSRQFDAMLQGGPREPAAHSGQGRERGAEGLGLLNAFENLHEYRSRIRCATLPWTALLDALKSERTM
jgi:nitrogen fixation NifU-like protein